MSNPYRTPETSLEVTDEFQQQLNAPQKLSAGQGWSWFTSAISLFMQSPLIWIVILIIWLLILMVLSVIPIVSLLAQIIGPIFIGGMMLGCRALDKGDSLAVDHLFQGFRDNTSQLAALGVIQFVATMGILIVSALPLLLLGAISLSDFTDPAAQSMSQQTEFMAALLFYMLTAMALTIPLLMGIWFAPSLIALHDMKAWQAFKLSFKACKINMLPFLIYGLVGLLFAVLAMIPFGLGFLVLIPVIICSMYTAYKSIFIEAST